MSDCWEADMACCTEWETIDPSVQARASALAWSTIRNLSGQRTGNCPVKIRPCLTAPCDCCNGNWMSPAIIDGQWVNCICGNTSCSCGQVCEIIFPGSVARIDKVDLGGVEVPLTAFRIDNTNRLVREDGMCWPACQDMGAPEGAPNTLTITYVPGIDPGPSGAWAAGVLACEFAKACSGAKCRLPSSVTAIARQGVSMTMQASMFENQQTGIREVDAYLLSVNPAHLLQPSLVWSPDLVTSGHRYPSWTPPPPEPPPVIVPVIAALAPNTVPAGSANFSVFGTGFDPAVVLKAQNTWTLTRTWISATQLDVTWDPGAGVYDIVAINPDLQASNPMPLTVV